MSCILIMETVVIIIIITQVRVSTLNFIVVAAIKERIFENEIERRV